MQTEKIGIQESVDQLDAPVISSWTLAAEQTHMAMKQLEACFLVTLVAVQRRSRPARSRS